VGKWLKNSHIQSLATTTTEEEIMPICKMKNRLESENNLEMNLSHPHHCSWQTSLDLRCLNSEVNEAFVPHFSFHFLIVALNLWPKTGCHWNCWKNGSVVGWRQCLDRFLGTSTHRFHLTVQDRRAETQKNEKNFHNEKVLLWMFSDIIC